MIIVLAVLLAGDIIGQNKGAVLQIGVTGTGYYGDLNAGEKGLFSATYFSVSPGFDITLQPSTWGKFAPQIRVGYARFQAQDPDARANPPEPISTSEGVIIPNAFADVTLPYLALGVEWHLFKRKRRFSPLASFGVRILSFSSKNEEGTPLAQLWTTRLPVERSLPSLSPSLDLGLGFESRLNERLRLIFVYHHIRSGSDYLDNLGALGRLEGNDRLHSLRVSLGFDLGKD
ncbi:MAG: hypothetical protein AB8F95_09815 [Bacteroidia bacterium]